MLHPDQTFTIDVDSDSGLPDEKHRRFEFKYGSAAAYMEIEDLLDDGANLTSRKVHDALARRLANPSDAKRLAHETTPTEQVGILVQLDVRQSLSESLAKKSKPLSPSSAVPSAEGATSEAMAAAAS